MPPLTVFKKTIRMLKKERFFLIAALTSAVVLTCSIAMFLFERAGESSTIGSLWDGIWWAFVTISTVGYGDVIPQTALGKALGMVIAILGIGMFALPAGILGSGFFEEVQRKRREPEVCPHCGKEISKN